MRTTVHSKVLVQAAMVGLVLSGLVVNGRVHAAGSASGESRMIPPKGSDTSSRGPTTGPRASQGQRPAAGDWWSTLGGLAAVLALIFIAARLLRKNMPGAEAALPAHVVQVLGRKSLDYRHTIHLVRLGSRLLVLGSSQEGLRTLSEITDPVEVDCLAGSCKSSESPSSLRNFGDLLRKFQNPAPVDAEAHPEPDPEHDSDIEPTVLRLQQRLRLAGVRSRISPSR